MSKSTDEIIKKRHAQIAFLKQACIDTEEAYTILCDRIIEQYKFFSENTVLEIPSCYGGPFVVSAEIVKIPYPCTEERDFSYVSLKDPKSLAEDNPRSLIVDKNLLEQMLGTHHICIYCDNTDDEKGIMRVAILIQYIDEFRKEYNGESK